MKGSKTRVIFKQHDPLIYKEPSLAAYSATFFQEHKPIF